MLRFGSNVFRTGACVATRQYQRPLFPQHQLQQQRNKITLSFSSPSSAIKNSEEVLDVLVPSTTGDFLIKERHQPNVAELSYGVVKITPLSGETQQYFVGPGFASVNSESVVNITVSEAVSVKDLDMEFIRRGLQTWGDALSSAKSDEEKAVALVAHELHKAMERAASS